MRVEEAPVLELPELSRRRDTGTRKDWGIWNRLGRCGWGLGPVRRLVVGTEQGRDGQSTSGHSLSQLRPATAGLKRRERKVRRRWVRGRSESGRGIHAQSHDVRPEVTSPSPRERNHFLRRRQSPLHPVPLTSVPSASGLDAAARRLRLQRPDPEQACSKKPGHSRTQGLQM